MWFILLKHSSKKKKQKKDKHILKIYILKKYWKNINIYIYINEKYILEDVYNIIKINK